MLLALKVPFIEHAVEGGTIAQWYKAEGEWVDYGDDLFDLRVEAMKVLGRSNRPEVLSNLTEDRIRERTIVHTSHRRVLLVRVTSSDMGLLRRIEAPAESYRAVGERVGIVTTEPDEDIDVDAEILAKASEFRVIANKSVS